MLHRASSLRQARAHVHTVPEDTGEDKNMAPCHFSACHGKTKTLAFLSYHSVIKHYKFCAAEERRKHDCHSEGLNPFYAENIRLWWITFWQLMMACQRNHSEGREWKSARVISSWSKLENSTWDDYAVVFFFFFPSPQRICQVLWQQWRATIQFKLRKKVKE